MRLQDKVVVITGASRGIGAAVARAAASGGAKIGLIARSRDDLEAVLAAAGGRGAVAVADVGEHAAYQWGVKRSFRRELVADVQARR